MKIMVVGCRPYDFDDKKTGRKVSGLSLYYTAPAEDVRGMVASKLSVKSGSELYHRLMAADYTEPFMANAVHEVMPGSNRATLIDMEF